MVPLDSMQDGMTWVEPKISGAIGALVDESIEMRNWLIHFGCAL